MRSLPVVMILLWYIIPVMGSALKRQEKRYPQVDLRPPSSPNKIAVINENTHNLAELFETIKAKGTAEYCNRRLLQ